jgi:hypothetical protein
VLPHLSGRPIRVQMRHTLGPHSAATSLPRRVILLDIEVLARRGEFERILVHELFHFAWVRLSNEKRWSWEHLLGEEFTSGTPGELGWSAEWRKAKLARSDARRRTARWRRYACESFCDTAAWLYAGLHAHDEFTLPVSARQPRRSWFREHFRQAARI